VADSPYAPSDLGGAPVAPTTALPIVTPAAPTTYAPSNLGPLSAAIEHHESGGNVHAVSPAGAQGPRQIMPGTFKQWALPGENINNPTDNRAVSNRMLSHYLQQYNGDAARAAVAYFSGPGNVAPPGSPTPWISNKGDGNNTVSQYVAATAGRIGAYAGAPAAATPAAAQPAQPAGVGAALAALNTPTGGTGTKSTMDNLNSMAGGGGGGGGGGSPPPMNLEGQQSAASMGNLRQQQLAMQGAQLAAALRAKQGLPGIPGPSSNQAFMGGAMIPMPTPTPTPGAPAAPGTTINSTGGLYG
jgi:Transglycosylase SLT domain